MKTRLGMRFAGMVLACLWFVGCVDSPVASNEAAAPLTDNNQLAVNFDAMAQEQAAAGDVERAEEFRWAALAVRHGIVPQRFEVENNGQVEHYDAFVHSARWIALAQALRPAAHRSFIAWRVDDSGMRVILIGQHSDSAPVLHPYSMRPAAPGGLTSPVLAAHAAYFERGPQGSAWLGVSGWAKVSLASTGGACPVPEGASRPEGVMCETARYRVAFDIDVGRTQDFESRVLAQSVTRTLKAVQQSVGGVHLSFTCVAPRSDRGCG